MRTTVILLSLLLSSAAFAAGTRPDGAVTILPNFCGCNNSDNILAAEATCDAFCQGKNTSGTDRLYVNFSPNRLITQNRRLRNVQGWCNNDLPRDENVRCNMVFRYQINDDQASEEQLAINFRGTQGNAGWVSIDSLTDDQTYDVTLRATSNAGNRHSSVVQVRKVSRMQIPEDTGPISLAPVSQYSCINRHQNGSLSTIDELVSAFQQHFYFLGPFRPDALHPGVFNIFCHNVLVDGPRDNNAFERLFETPNALALWSKTDSRMLNLRSAENTSGGGWTNAIDAEDMIAIKLRELGGFPSTARNFGELQVVNGPVIDGNVSAVTTGSIGWFLRPFITGVNSLATCPTQQDYHSSNKLFQAIGSVIQVGTEAFYLARREVATYTDYEVGGARIKCVDDDFILVRESDVRRSWFYYANGATRRPNSEGEIKQNTMRFFYPFADQDLPIPPTSHPWQKTYTIITLEQGRQDSIGCLPDSMGVPQLRGASEFGVNVPTHDKRLGCIPKSED